jgi:ribosome biogenesis GTP-binding protein YsxC/EngB
MAHRHLSALLGMPPSLRPLLFATQAPVLSRSQLRALHVTSRACARSLKRPVTVGAFKIPHSPNLPLSDIPIDQLLESPTPDGSLTGELTALFTKNPATFYHGTSDFYTLKKNTRIPEICILGRSNVGKSTFVNALANRRDNELAHTSAKAGKTRAMNAFGFGPAPLMKDLADTDTKTKRTEDLPKHQLFVVDMPGYGHKSLKEWGKNINLYLNKRQAVKGAVLLIDGEVGPKSGDLMAMKLLQEAGVRTAIVFTKADKAKNEQALRDTCREVWTAMREINNRNLNSKWKWETDFFVTALGATKKDIGSDTISVARLAVARLAGLVQEKERPEQQAPKGYSGKIVSFDDLQFALSQTPQSPAESQISKAVPVSSPAPSPAAAPTSAFDALEQAAMEQHQAREAFTCPSRTSSWDLPEEKPRRTQSLGPRRGRTLGLRRTQTRAFHTTRCLPKMIDGREPPTTKELHTILEEFVANLETSAASTNRAALASVQDTPGPPRKHIWDPTFVKPSAEKARLARRVKRNKPMHLQIYERRLEEEQYRKNAEQERLMWEQLEKRSRRGRSREGGQPRHRWNDEQENEGLESREGRPGEDGDAAAADEGLDEAWKQMENIPLHARKSKKAKKEKRRRRKAEEQAQEEDEFEAKFKDVR